MRMKNIYSYLRALLMLLFLTSGVGTMWGESETLFDITSYSSLPTGWTCSGVETGSYFKFSTGGSMQSPTYAAHDNVVFTYKVAKFGNGTNPSLTIEVCRASDNQVLKTETSSTPTSSTYISDTKNLGDIAEPFYIKLSTANGLAALRLQVPKLTGDVVSTGDDVAVEGVSVSPTTATLTVGETTTLAATISPVDATNKSVTWESNDPTIASVDNNGVVTAIAAGTATITETTADGKKTANCIVTVNSATTGGETSSYFIIDVTKGNTTPAFETGSTSNYPKDKTITLNGCGLFYSGVYFNTSKYLMFIKNAGYIYNTTSLGNIQSVTVHYSNSTAAGTCAIKTGSSALSARITAAGEGITSAAASSNGQMSHTAGNNEGYFQISNIDDGKNIQIEKIVITLGETSTEPTVYYTISLGDLTSDCSSTEDQKSVASGSTNNTFIVIPDAGYDLETSDFIVEMGGDELTAGTDYTYDKANCTLIISTAITGNVVVDAMATRLVTISLDAASENCTAESIQVRSGSSDVQFPINVATGYVLDAESIELSPSKTFVWDTTTGILTITGTVDDDISVLALAEAIPLTEYTITFVDKGETCGTATVVDGAEITFPADRTGVNGWTFVGWSIKTSDITQADIYTNDNKPTASGNVVYHAIYSKTTDSGSTTTSITITGDDVRRKPGGGNNGYNDGEFQKDGMTFQQVDTYKNNGGIQLKANTGCFWNVTEFGPITKIEVKGKTNSSDLYLGTTLKPTTGHKVECGDNLTVEEYNATDSYTFFNFTSGSNYSVIEYIKVDYLKSGVTTTYSTTCPAPVTLESIAVTTNPTKMVYKEGETLDLEGIVVTATYSDDTTADVTERATFSPAAGSVLNTVGTQTITVTYGEMTTSFDVTVNARQYCNITWNVNGTVTTERQEQGAHLAMPVNPTLEDVVFMGWIVDGETFAADGSDFEEKKLDANATVPTLETITYLAVFATPEDSEETSTITLTKDNVHSGYTTDGVDRDMKDITGFKYYGCTTAQRSGSNEYTLIQMRKPSGSAPDIIATSWIYNTSELNIKQIVIQYDDQNENVATLRFGNMQNPMTEPTTPVIDGYIYTYNNVGRHPYFRISNDEAGAVQIESIDIVCNVSTTYSDYRTKVMLNPHLSFDAPTYILRDGDNWVMPVATSKNTDVVITYTSENSSVAEIVDNEIRFKGCGTTTITATQAENDTYAAAKATCTLKFVPASVSVTTNGYGWATYAPSYDIMVDNMQVSQGIARVFYVTQLKQENDKDVVATNDAVEALGADKAMATATGVLIWTREPNTTITFTCSTITDKDHISELPGNMLVGVTEETDLDGRENAYIFTQKNGNIGFYKWTSGILVANKCYLQLPEGSNAASLSIMLPNGDETAIGSVFGGEGNAPMYNLDGRRVNSNYRGIVIINGKKVVNK